MELFILRHAEAGKALRARSRDAERSLTEKGKEELEEVARALSGLKMKPDYIVSSPLNRSKETAEAVAKALKARDRVQVWDELKPEGSRQAFFGRLSQLKPESNVLCVGHEPYLTQAVNELMGHSGAPRLVLRRCGLARVSITAFLPKTEGELRWLLTPRLLKRMS
ncbi:MAG: phosphohistidine phosphatase SixA [Nitrososphaerota archaeon]|nr:phosphohistidine phosphatase SixA [Nitrososphaerota archaeon]MDG6966405.1 phosphohistidine phosphatase SixA [Nitrososphaerota archaeon]MDG6979097.1 phosphohistidine phosphatase SixA [Nitrososphaerota archaeon]MDG7006310.1 phosphohistidine phosphatase SixA [Nitrososphaerota archaeon]MDG7020546.1 phosphohistidine phosphatase SixA [Nitrososphaerota archaeon]